LERGARVCLAMRGIPIARGEPVHAGTGDDPAGLVDDHHCDAPMAAALHVVDSGADHLLRVFEAQDIVLKHLQSVLHAAYAWRCEKPSPRAAKAMSANCQSEICPSPPATAIAPTTSSPCMTTYPPGRVVSIGSF